MFEPSTPGLWDTRGGKGASSLWVSVEERWQRCRDIESRTAVARPKKGTVRRSHGIFERLWDEMEEG
jgi:hypothetical protein